MNSPLSKIAVILKVEVKMASVGNFSAKSSVYCSPWRTYKYQRKYSNDRIKKHIYYGSKYELWSFLIEGYKIDTVLLSW